MRDRDTFVMRENRIGDIVFNDGNHIPDQSLLLFHINPKGMKELNNLLKVSQRFIKKNSATILTVVGATGVVATAVSTAKATTKANQLLADVEVMKGVPLTAKEKIRVAAPVYIPSVLFGVATVTAIFGANHLNKQKQASLIGAYSLLDQSYKNYKSKVKELYGKDGHDHVVDEMVRADIENAPRVYEPEKELFYDLYSERYFENTMENVLKAESEMNKLMHTDWGVGVNEFYKMLGLDTVPEFEEIGWTSVQMQDMYWHSWIEFEHRKVVMDDGLECIILELPMEPVIDYLEY